MGDPESRGPYRARLVRVPGGPPRRRSSEDARERMRDNPLRLFDTKDPRVAEVMAGRPEADRHTSRRPPRTHRERVLATPWPGSASPSSEDPHLVRGFDYYTMTVFEFTSDHLGRPERGRRRRPLRRARRGPRRSAHARASASARASSASCSRWSRWARPRRRRPRRLPGGARRRRCALELLPLLEAPARGRPALRERPARPQHEEHDAARRVPRGAPRGDRGAARARGGGRDGA